VLSSDSLNMLTYKLLMKFNFLGDYDIKQDVLQEMRIALFILPDDGEAHPKGYFFSVAYNAGLNFLIWWIKKGFEKIDNVKEERVTTTTSHAYRNTGEKAPTSKFTNEQAEKIRELYFKDKLSITEIKDRYNVCFETISQIVNNKTYWSAGGKRYKKREKRNKTNEKLTEDQVREIRSGKMSRSELQDKYYWVSKSTVDNIRYGVTYKWVKDIE